MTSHDPRPRGPHVTPHKTRAQERIEALDVRPSALLEQIETLKAELAAAKSGAEEYLAGLQRERAEFINFKRRTAEEREASLGLASESLLRKVLALADDFDRAIEARPPELAGNGWVEGIAAIDRKLRVLLESEGVAPIVAAPGTRFDPREHEAIVNVADGNRHEGEIVDELQRGYRLRDRVLRPALVAVAAAPEGSSSQGAAPRPAAGTSGNETTDISND